MSQVFLIKQDNDLNPNLSKFYKSAFTNYAESRRMALSMVNRINKNVKKKIDAELHSSAEIEITEITPDLWSNGLVTISIIAMPKN